MRGKTTLHSDIFTIQTNSGEKRKGRSALLINRRNELLINRYYFYAIQEPKLQFDYIISLISGELFISPLTIVEIIAANREVLAKLRKQQPDSRQLAQKWGFFVWDSKRLLSFT